MIKMTFSIGTQDKDNKDISYNVNDIKATLASKLDYATLTDCIGCYKYNDGTVCFEPSLKVDVICFDLSSYKDKQSIINTIDDVCKIYNQESYLFETQTNDRYDATIVYVK